VEVEEGLSLNDIEYEEVLRLLSLAAGASLTTTTATMTFPLLHVTKVDLPGCDLDELPPCLPQALPNLSILFLSNNCFRIMPEVIGRCRQLQMVAFKSNGMTGIHPDALQPQLRWLILTDNQLSQIPSTSGRCNKLQKLMLSGNALTELPPEMVQCTRLELLRLASNRLVEPPLHLLLQLPSLCWIGLSDNPFLHASNNFSSCLAATSLSSSSLPAFEDLDEDDGEILGQGAGGVVRKVQWKENDGSSYYVAVKTFTGAMTSDGLAAQERTLACAVSGTGPCFVQVLGETPQGSLVMEYLGGYRALASPPSFETCSRDVYDTNISLSYHQAVSVVSKLLQALVTLHRAGICHGDFYAHNILFNDQEEQQQQQQVRLTDFGAAFFYDKQSPYGKLVERTELRAFAVLVEELVEHVVILDEGEQQQQEGNSSTLLSDFVNACRKAAEAEEGFETQLVWWKQRRLQDLAKALDGELDL
jgi:tRNA A-37 threonylcarbamoyl transferase component Bud32